MKSVLVILNYNDGKNTCALAKKVKSFPSLSHILLVDNCSTDQSLSFMKSLEKGKIKVLSSPENGGYAKGNNLGIFYAIDHYHPDYIFVANPDIQVSQASFVKILQSMEAHPEDGILSCMVKKGYNVWNLPSFIGVIESLFLIWFNLDKRRIRKKLLSSSKDIEEVGVVEGSFFCIRTEAFKKIKGLDERTFLYGEEIILSKRLKKGGYKVGVLPHSFYEHFHSVSIRKTYGSKAKAFSHFYDSFVLYNREYLHTNKIQDFVFYIAYRLAYFERILYDWIMKKR